MNTAVKAYIYYFHTVPNSKDKNVHAANCLYYKCSAIPNHCEISEENNTSLMLFSCCVCIFWVLFQQG